MWLQLQSKYTEFSANICIAYLPPKGTTRPLEAEEFYNELLTQVYQYQGADVVCVAGDFNGRCGELPDYIEGADEVMPREVVDYTENEYGDLLIDFAINTNMCMLNGRGVEKGNNFTFISKTGKSVVDYALVPHEQLDRWSNFKVLTVTDIISHNNLPPPECMPDHSVLAWNLNLPTAIQDISQSEQVKKTRYDVRTIPEDFMDHTQVRTAVERIEQCLQQGENLDSVYEKFVDVVQEEMNHKLPKQQITIDGKKLQNVKHKMKCKPYWNNELQTKFHDVCLKEKCFVKAKTGIRNKLNIIFVKDVENFKGCYVNINVNIKKMSVSN